MAWLLAVAGPVLVVVAMLPVRRSVGLAGLLFALLLAVVAVAIAGGVPPALLATVVGFTVGAWVFAPPYGSFRIERDGDLIGSIAFLIVGTALGILVDALARLADEQAALRRVATLTAGGAPQDEVFTAVVQEVGRLIRADLVQMGRYEPDGSVAVLSGWRQGRPFILADREPLGGTNMMTLVADTRQPSRIDDYAEASGALGEGAREAGVRASVGAPIVVEGRLWGVMVAGSMRRPFRRGMETRLADVTDLVGASIANAESRQELAASRARVVAAADATRRRIERDLHDGTQQSLVTLGLELRALETMVPRELVAVREQLGHTEKGLSEALEAVQELSRGIHPAVLTRGGLGPALRTLARRCPVPVELDVASDGRLPDRVEVAAYYTVAEALTNAAKHARASVVQVGVRAGDGAVRLSIRDDGVGGADPARGSGLLGLRDRVETAGGRLEIHSPVGEGTALEAVIPIG
ncbi:MAG TPA: DUF4118 domain-containing protein [Actinomycetota bacterium]|nr:DUF4118 domain-containing protein [Actinomycetota bacterium]